MRTQLLILFFFVVINGGRLIAAPFILEGYVTNAGLPVSNEWVNIQIAGADTSVMTDTTGNYRTTLNPSTANGTLRVFFLDCRMDTINQFRNYDTNTRQLLVNLSGCNQLFNLRLNGQVLNYPGGPGTRMWVHASFDNFGNIPDSILVDSLGFFDKTIASTQSQGVVAVRISTCSGNYDTDSNFYRTGDSLTFTLDYCNNPPAVRSGTVRLNSTPVGLNSVYILRYEYDTVNLNFNFVDTLSVSGNGSFQYSDNLNSEYLLKAMPNMPRPAFAATYYPNGVAWDSRQTLAALPDTFNPLDINLIQVRSLFGSNQVSGRVQFDSTIEKAGYKAVGIHLLDTNGSVVAFDFANPSGVFQFTNLEDGVYKLQIDQCGIPLISSEFYLNASRPQIEDIVILASEEAVFIGFPLGDEEVIKQAELNLYPNPIVNQFTIAADYMEHIQVMNLSGAIIYNAEIESRDEVQIETQDWPAGTYIVNIISKSGSYQKKIIKQ